MTLNSKLSEVSSAILTVMPELPQKWINLMSNQIKTYVICRCLDNKTLDSDTYAIANELSPLKINSGYSLEHYVSMIKDIVRENSHGATAVNLLFISPEARHNYAKAMGVLDISSCIKIYGVAIIPSVLIKKDGKMIALCQPKYEGITFDRLILPIEIGD